MARVLKTRGCEPRPHAAVWVWYAENASIEMADRFLRAADNTLDLLSKQPESGTAVFVRKPELRNMRLGPREREQRTDVMIVGGLEGRNVPLPHRAGVLKVGASP